MLRQKMLQDMKANKWQFLSILLMAFLGVYIFTGVGGEWAGVNHYRKGYYQETNLANGWVWGEGFSDSDVSKIKAIPGVTGAEKRCYLEVKGQDSHDPTIYLYGLKENTICMPKVVEGSPVDLTAKDKVWVDARFAAVRNLKVGDSYTFLFENVPFTLQVAGLVYSSEYQYYANENDLWPDYNNIGFAYCAYTALPMQDYIVHYIESSKKSVSQLIKEFSKENAEIARNAKLISRFSKKQIVDILKKADPAEFADMVPYTQIVLTTEKDSLAADIGARINKVLEGNYAVYTTRAETSGIAMMDAEMEQHKTIGAVFPIVFLLIAVLAIVTCMNRMIHVQRTQIGTLKALGFTKAQITRHYVNYGFWPSLLGAVLGCIIGPVTLPFLFYSSMSSYYTLPEWKAGFDISFALVAAGTVAACTLATLFTVVGMLGESPAQTLRPKAPRNFKLTKLERAKGWGKMKFSFRWSWRTFTRGKVRTVMGIVGTVGCMALLIAAFSMYDCMSDMESWQYDQLQTAQTRLTLAPETTNDQAKAIADQVDGELLMTTAIEIQANGVKKTANATITDGSGCNFVTDTSRKQITPDDNMMALTQPTAKALGLKEGDTFRWHIYTSDKWVTSTVTLICRNPMTQGLTMTRATLERLGYEFTPGYVDTQQALTSFNNSHVTKTLTNNDMHNFWSNYMESMNMMVSILILFAVILAVVVLYNLGQINFTEQERENATLKVIGFSTGRILRFNLLQNLVYAAIGILLGTPLGLYLVYIMISTSGDSFDMMVKLTPVSFIICAAITLVVSTLVSLLFTRYIKKLDMVTSLKGVE